MRRWTLFGLVLAAALLSVPLNLFAQDTAPERTLNVVETDPAPGEQHAPGDPVIFYFDAALDCATAAAAVSSDSVSGTTACDGSTLTFMPDVALVPATDYTFTVDSAVKSADGAAMAEPFKLVVSTRGYLEVTSVVPADQSAEVESNTEITVVFNRPVVPLTTLDEQAGFPQPLTFDPPVAGHGRWIGTSVYQFVPDPSLAGGTDYTVTVDAALTAVDGAVQMQPFTFQFSTQNPQVLEFKPTSEELLVPLSQDIQVRFNQPMDRASTEEAFFLNIQEVPGEIAGTFTWADDDSGFMFTPAGGLTLETSYTYGFAPDAAFNASKAQTLAPFGINFYTSPFPAVLETYPRDGESGVPPYDGIVLSFASKMNPETLLERIVIEPAPEDTEGYFAEYNNQYTVYFPLRGDTAYTVTLLPGMEDVYGNVIDTTLTFSFSTRSKDAEMSLNIPYSGIGLYDADRDTTALYVTHMNVSSVDLALYQVNAQTLVDNLMSEQYYQTVGNIARQSNALVKTWTMAGADLKNVRRLDLVNVGAPGSVSAPVNGVSVVNCPGAMPSRVHVGDRAQVITDPDPTRARSAPVTGDILELMYKGYSFPITGGPDCRDGIVWWEIQLRDGQTAWVAEGLNNEYFFEVTQAAGVSSVPLSNLTLDGGALPIGVYLLQASSQSIGNTNDPINHIMLVSDTALLMKRGASRTVVWATDIHTGLPAAGVTVSLYSQDSETLSAVTDSSGVATFEHPRRSDLYRRALAIVNDGEHFGLTASDWADGLYPYQFGIDLDSQPAAWRFFLYTDRPVYRPGQPVHYRGVVRAKQDNNYTLTDFETVDIVIRNSSYEEVATVTLPLSRYGTFESTFTLDADAPLGYYQIEAILPVEGDDYQARGQVGFDVAEYRLPEFEVTVSPDTPEVLQGDTILATVDTRYFFGGPVANANVDYYVSTEAYYFDYQGTGNYSFSYFDPEAPRESLVANPNGSGTTDATGMLTLEIPAGTGAQGQSVTYRIEAVVSDESGQSISGSTRVDVHQGDVYVGVSPRDFIGAAGQPVVFDLISTDWDSAAVPGQAVDVEVIEQRWNSVQQSDGSGGIMWKSEAEYIPVTSGTVTTDSEGRAEFSFEPPNGGIFQLIASTRDAKGNRVRAASSVWVAGSGFVAWRQTNSTGINLIADKTSYEVGDTAEILITSPFMGRTEALVTLERDGVLRTERLTMDSNSTVYRLPIEEDFAPTIYVGVVLMKGVDENNPVADMRVGYVRLPVDNQRFNLNIEITPDTALAGPRDTVTYTIKATDYAGAPVQAELGVALTDLAALSLGTDYAGEILDGFYGFERLAVMMSSGMILNTDLITEFTRDVIKGGGGGGGGEMGIIDLREQFIDTAFWNGQLETDANGTATVSITLPDNLTTWRMVVRGVTDGVGRPLLVGQATNDVVATKPLIVRPVAPRFMVRGDSVTLGAVVNNNTLDALSVDVSLQATGVTLAEGPTQTVSIPAQGRGRVNWTATVDDVESVELIFAAVSGDFSDATRPAFGQGDDRLLPVYKYEVPEFVGTGGTLREASTRVEAVVLPRRYAVTEGTLTVELEPSLAVATLKAIKALEGSPCECTETTGSRLAANVAGLRALRALGNPSDPRLAALESEINLSIQRLGAQQHVDGGWGWFSSLSSDPLVTAWTLIALTEAQEVTSVYPGIIEMAATYLKANLTTGTRSDQDFRLNRAAIIVYALAKANAKDLAAPISNLYDLRDRLSIYAKSLLLGAIMRVQPDDATRRIALRDELLNAVIVSANGAHWEEASRDWYNWNSNTRTTSMVLRTLLLLDSREPLLPNVVRWLMIARQADSWQTTQETAWAVLALTDWMTVTGETQPDFSYTVDINGQQAVEKTLTPADAATSEIVTRDVSELNAQAPNPVEISRGAGSGALYYTAYLHAYLPVPEVDAVDNGLTVSRVYRILGEDAATTTAHVGDLVEVTVTLIAPNALNFIVLEDPLPAGTEAINPDLNTSQQTGTTATFESASDEWFYSYWWADIQYKDEKVVLSADYVAPGTYEFKYVVRATVEGTYNVIPTTGYEYYLPEVYGRGAGSLFTVLPAEEQ